MIYDQWSDRLITKSDNIPLYTIDDQHPKAESLYDLFKDSTELIPDSLALTNFQPELNYFMEKVLGYDP